MRSLLLAFLAFHLLSCGARALTDDEKKAKAQEIALTFFTIVERGDCDALLALLAKAPPKEECPALLEELKEKGTKLLAIVKATLDGRDHEAVIVTVSVE